MFDLHDKRLPLTVTALITAVNVGLIFYFLASIVGSTSPLFNGMGIYLLAGLELAAIFVAYKLSKPEHSTVTLN